MKANKSVAFTNFETNHKEIHMSIKKLVAEKIESIRSMIAVWDNPIASQEEKGKVLSTILGHEPKFWEEIARRALASKHSKKATKADVVQAKAEPITATNVVVVQKAPVSMVARPTPAKLVAATAQARTLRVQPAVAGTSDFADKLNGAAKGIGLEDHTPLARFRQLLKMEGRQVGSYWAELRGLLEVVLQKKAIQEVSDWKLLVAKAKKNLFFGGKNGGAFLAQCPKEGVADLLLADDGLWALIEDIRIEREANQSSPFHVAFVIDACGVVGKEAKNLLDNCKHAVNRMKQMGFIEPDHWLVQKVAAMKAPSSVDHKLDQLQEMTEAPTVTVN
ncbi:MAG: hypothetical protein AAB350_02365 [Patescibacteria group bacterium]